VKPKGLVSSLERYTKLKLKETEEKLNLFMLKEESQDEEQAASDSDLDLEHLQGNKRTESSLDNQSSEYIICYVVNFLLLFIKRITLSFRYLQLMLRTF
jgi:hypothetical protein